MSDTRLIAGADGEKHIMRGNKMVGYVTDHDMVWLFIQGDAKPIGEVEHPSEVVRLVDEWFKQK